MLVFFQIAFSHPMLPDFREIIPFLEGSQTLPVFPSGKSNMLRKVEYGALA
jgi:hypothetical protein